jgi:hypothetical protein
MDSREAGKAAGAPDSGGITGITETGIIVTSSTLSACTKGGKRILKHVLLLQYRY